MLRNFTLAVLLCISLMTAHAAEPKTTPRADGTDIQFYLTKKGLQIDCRTQGPDWDRTVFVALDTDISAGSAVLPYNQKSDGSTVFLPFNADLLYFASLTTDDVHAYKRVWKKTAWSDRVDAGKELGIKAGAHDCTLTIPRGALGKADKVGIVVYSKDFTKNSWGSLFGCNDPGVAPGPGDKYIPHYYEINLNATGEEPVATLKSRLNYDAEKVRIYQLFVRIFGNTNETRKPNGTLADNGSGKFDDINDSALASIKELGFTHVWLTGVLRQATATDYSSIGLPADDPDLLKGLAGSPYAVKDYFDVCPDYATDPAKRLDEFKALIGRAHSHGLKAIIDLVPNHVARSYHSTVMPGMNFGAKDDRTKFFDPQNNFFYLKPGKDGPPLHLPTCKDGVPLSPTCKVIGKCDGLFDGEMDHGKVTGNNKASWTPDINDWYETIKLNYGFDFTDNSRHIREYPTASRPDKPIPDTWKKVDAIIAYWQEIGVDGFRCDMSHMIPAEFWAWAIGRARARNASVFFMGEAYDGDPAKVGSTDPVITGLGNGSGHGNVLFDLLSAGFNAVYGHPAYQKLKDVYDGNSWANDLDNEATVSFIFENSLHYAENHDETRLAGKNQWGNTGMEVGRPATAILYALSRGPVMLYSGQEVGEPANDAEGFGGDDARTSLFDYWSMPEMIKWVNSHQYDGAKLSDQQKALRDYYARLLRLIGEPAFRNGAFFALNPANKENPRFGRTTGESASGHWIYAFLRRDAGTGQAFLVIVNLNKSTELHDIIVHFPKEALAFLGITPDGKELKFTERLSGGPKLSTSSEFLSSKGLEIPSIPELTPYYFEITQEQK
jgi:glycosidase